MLLCAGEDLSVIHAVFYQGTGLQIYHRKQPVSVLATSSQLLQQVCNTCDAVANSAVAGCRCNRRAVVIRQCHHPAVSSSWFEDAQPHAWFTAQFTLRAVIVQKRILTSMHVRIGRSPGLTGRQRLRFECLQPHAAAVLRRLPALHTTPPTILMHVRPSTNTYTSAAVKVAVAIGYCHSQHTRPISG